ncbi:MAG: ornithine cyclodeaminase family protein [Pyrinomonadaceae bacterium]
MKLLILTHDEVIALLPMHACIAVMGAALAAHARGEVQQPLRTIFNPLGAKGVLSSMPAYRSGADALYGLKAICVFPDNSTRNLDAHQGGVLLFSGTTGEPLALMNASAITAIRTAAVSALATQALALPAACELALIGAGVQARAHLAALAEVRALKRVRIVSRDIEHAQALADSVRTAYAFSVEPMTSVERAVRGADLIVTATNARTPVLRREWIRAGAHINAVGACTPNARELDAGVVVAATLFVDSRESARNEAGDYLLAISEGAITPAHIRAELGEVLTGQHPGRTAPDEITLFKSLGIGAEDLAAAAYVYQQAQAQGTGTWVEF